MCNMTFFCAGYARSRSLDRLLQGSAEIVVLDQVLQLGCAVDGLGQDRGTVITIRAGIGDLITGVGVTRTHGTCPDGTETGRGSETAEIIITRGVAAEFAAVAEAAILV